MAAIARAAVLDFHNYGVEARKMVYVKLYVGLPLAQFRLVGQEQGLEIAPLAEDIVKISAPGGIPAVLRAENAHIPVHQSLVQLVFYGSCPETKHSKYP